MNIEEAKKILKCCMNDDCTKCEYADVFDCVKEHNEAIETVLSELEKKDKRLNRQFKLFQKKDKEIAELKADNNHQWEERCKLTFELEKKDKVINEMAKHIQENEFYDDIICMEKNCKNEACHGDCGEDCIKEYFTNKVEREGK